MALIPSYNTRFMISYDANAEGKVKSGECVKIEHKGKNNCNIIVKFQIGYSFYASLVIFHLYKRHSDQSSDVWLLIGKFYLLFASSFDISFSLLYTVGNAYNGEVITF